MTNPRRIALEALLDITEAGAYANLRLKEALTGLPQREARWVSAMVYTTLDHLLYIDYVLAHFAKGRTQPVIRGILRMGVAQLLYMEVPDSAACNESVNLCKKVGKNKLSGYVNGVLRAICRNRENLPPLPDNSVDRLSIQFSWPRWLVDEYVAQYGTEFTTALLDAKAPGMTLRAQYPIRRRSCGQPCKQQIFLFDRGGWFRRPAYWSRGWMLPGTGDFWPATTPCRAKAPCWCASCWRRKKECRCWMPALLPVARPPIYPT